MSIQIRKNFDLGIKLEDQITKFQGIATAKTIYLNYEYSYLLEAKSDGGKVAESHWFDSARLVRYTTNAADEIIIEPPEKEIKGA